MVTVKSAVVSVSVPSVKLATSVFPGSAVPLIAETRSNWPDRLFAIIPSHCHKAGAYRDTVAFLYDCPATVGDNLSGWASSVNTPAGRIPPILLSRKGNVSSLRRWRTMLPHDPL